MSDTPMRKEVVVDWRRFDPLQMRLLEEIAGDIKRATKEAGLAQEKVRELTETLAFSIAAIIDGSRIIDIDGVPLKPVLTFAANEEQSQLIGADGGSWMHEYAIGIVEQLFENDEEAF